MSFSGNILKMHDEIKAVHVIYPDFENAFDKGLHKWLLAITKGTHNL